ncbi:hypothetical protein [Natrinema hispanicum]|uniref:DUF2800 family protein n=1 Tax=Natrinema hispanicum TaxID=392421 RepID=A0A1G6W7L4_9EURY|nr:hypothetical protein [Natrinema hispanicum]RZV06556.1 hypothetical protein BDK88_3573 [Natrinema hispanicum]SDD61217.1 hypothetical protein SAMN05192552_103426 [Natrinema hispanicum]SEU09828.1 hypothetical protein SAMN04488694_1448 [Natrinema hispanicum]
MPFSVSWHTLLEHLDELPADATLITPLSHSHIHITDIQEHRIIVQFDESSEKRPLQRDQFESLYHQIQTAHDGFDLDRLPPDADPYPAVLSVHPRFEIDEDAGVIAETDGPTTTQLADTAHEPDDDDRTEPDGLDVYSDGLLLIDALERHDVTDLPDLETATLVNLYTLLSDVQRDANDFRQEVADVLLSRLHHDRPVAGQYGSVQRTSRRNRSLKDDEDILSMLEAEGIDRERVMSVDRQKVDEALEVTTLTESDVYEIDESEYVRKAEVDDDVKESRLQGLKDRLAASEETEAEELRQEIEALEERIDDLTSFRAGTEVQG